MANQYFAKLELAAHRDEDGKVAKIFGFGENTKVLVFPAGSVKPVKYEGTFLFTRWLIGLGFLTSTNSGATKHESLTQFLKSILDGTADLKISNENMDNHGRVDDEL